MQPLQSEELHKNEWNATEIKQRRHKIKLKKQKIK